MKNIVFIVALLIFFHQISATTSFTIGSNTFFSSFLLTNGEYGSGAAFPSNVWFDGTLGLMRIDYYNPNGTIIMRVFYNYTSGDKYEVCGTNCAHATWNAPIPIFYGNQNTYASTSCQKPDYPGPYACSNYPNCYSWLSSPNQPDGIYSLSYTDSAGVNLCLARWTPAPGDTYGPEWQIQTYLYQSSQWNSTTNPTITSTYSSVIAGVTCPQPTCYAELDIAVIVDESGSIFQASAWNDVQAFVNNLISSFNMAPNAIRVGLAYFSGLQECSCNWTGTAKVACSDTNKNTDCSVCGGLWEQLTPGVTTDKAGLLTLVNEHQATKGYTCISCGIDVGIKILNFAPKANVDKLIILFTDGAQNRVTGSLALQGQIAYQMGIKVIAVATGLYKLSDLECFTSNIFTTNHYYLLSSLISSIVTPLCQPLPNIDTCDFCSGLCSCSTSCNCPSCNDYNACTTDNCNVAAPPVGTSGICVSIPITCDDNNPCTCNLCVNSTGCNYNTPTPVPPNLVNNNYCKKYICTNPQGFTLTDIGSTNCVQGTNLCLLNYCNTTVGTTNGLTGSCIQINKTSSSYPYGTTITYTNSAGQTLTTAGCGAPSGALPCQVYSCNSTDGTCIQTNKNCLCMTNSDCNDGNGCTNDVCNTTLNQCVNTPYDCYNILSSGGCVTNQAGVTASQVTGLGYYYSTISFSFNGNLPTTKTYTCDNLACFNGQRSSYTCSSTGNTSYVCLRQVVNCTSSGCTDQVCQTTGGWTNNQVNTNCGDVITRVCNDNNACTSDVCNSTWTGVSCTNTSCPVSSNRCIYASNSSNCNQASVCNTYSCIAATGCHTTALATPTPNACFLTGCNSQTGNYSTVNTTACPTSTTNLCMITYCNSTSQQCVTFNKATQNITNTTYYIDAYGTLQSVTGCYQPHPCIVYGCNSTSGLCTVNSSACSCTQNSDCNDGNGCTVDTCSNFACSNVAIDCFSQLSGGTCKQNAIFTKTNVTGCINYNAGSPINTFVNNSGMTCDQLACYSGQRSQYICQSSSNNSFTCQRTTSACAKGGCTDTICTSLGTWTNGQPNTDCSTTYTPSCPSNQCYSGQCNTSYVYGSGAARCIYTNNGSTCNDNSLCTQDLCINSTGCSFPPAVQPIANNTCFDYVCSATQGFQPVANNCTTQPNACQVVYCNTTQENCITLDKNVITYGTTVYYVDSNGITQSITGCANPGDPVKCKVYGCDQTSGVCSINSANCACVSNESCEDGNGCTVNVCDFNLNQCNTTNIDCFSILSNGSCSQYTTYSQDIFTGIDIYYGNETQPNNFTKVDANGLPFPNSGVVRTCGQLGCYGGQQSNYSCFSVAEGSYTCQRTYLNCSRNGCQDNICRALGTWSSTGQISTDCGTTYQPICSDDNACITNFCNSAWLPTQPVSQRCLHIPINGTTFCNDGNFCTQDYCDSQDTSGNPCRHNLYADWYIRQYLCTNYSVCQTVQCTVNKCIYTDIGCAANTLCIFYTCNASTNSTCKAFPTGIYTIDKCGVCGGNGLSCVPTTPGNPKKASIAVALGVGLGIGLFAAACIILALSKKSFDAYNALSSEVTGNVTNTPTYQGNENEINTNDYN